MKKLFTLIALAICVQGKTQSLYFPPISGTTRQTPLSGAGLQFLWHTTLSTASPLLIIKTFEAAIHHQRPR